MNVPNTLTALRLLAVPLFIWLFVRGYNGWALGVFIGAMITDGLDGIAARALKQFTRLGAAMDPLADKLLGLAAMGLLTWSGTLPVWLLALALARDACIFTAIALLKETGRSFAIRPSRFGKYGTFFLGATVILALVHKAHAPARVSEPALIALALVSAECMVVSWAQYLWTWIRLMRLPPGTPLSDLPGRV